MVMSDLETYIQAMRKDVTGDVLSRSRTMDALLDLRLEAAGRDDVTSLVDAALPTFRARRWSRVTGTASASTSSNSPPSIRSSPSADLRGRSIGRQ